MNDPLKEMIRAHVRTLLAEQIKAATAEVVAEEVSKAFKPTEKPHAIGTAWPEHLAPEPPRDGVRPTGPSGPRGRHQKYPAGTTVRINATYLGNPAAPGTDVYKCYQAIKQYVGEVNEVNRTGLARSIETLLNWKEHKAGTTISRLLKLGALVAVHHD